MQIVMHFKEIGLAICVKSLFKMHIFVLVIWFLKIYLKEKTKSLHDDLIMKTFTLALCIKLKCLTTLNFHMSVYWALGFLSLDTIDILNLITLFCAVLCIVGCLTPSLAPAH